MSLRKEIIATDPTNIKRYGDIKYHLFMPINLTT